MYTHTHTHTHTQRLLLLFSCLVVSKSLWLHGPQHSRLPCPSLSSRVCSDSSQLSRWCHPTNSCSVATFSSCPQSFPASGSFPTNQFLASSGQNIGASASVLPMNIQNWFPLGLTGWISLQPKGLSRVFSSTTVQKHWSSELSLFYGLILTSVHDYWKNHSFDYMDFSRQSKVSAF